MLDRLRTKLAAAGITNVDIAQAGFLTYEHDGERADVVYSRLALHHLPDAWKAIALARIRGLLHPGGLLRLADVVYDFEPDEAAARLEAWCATGGDSVEREWSRAELEEHVRDEHSTFTWVLEPMIRRAGFEIEGTERSDDGIYAAYVARAI
jgi:SAM-dependent methyltransferase